MCTRMFLLFCVLMAGCGKKDGGGSNVSEAVDAHGFTEEEATYYRTMGNLINAIRTHTVDAAGADVPGLLVEELDEATRTVMAAHYCKPHALGFGCSHYVKSRVTDDAYYSALIDYRSPQHDDRPNLKGFIAATASGAALEKP